MPIVGIIISGVMLGAAYVFQKLLAQTKYHPLTITISYSIVGMLLISPFAFVYFGVPHNPWLWVLTFISTGIFTVSLLSSINAYESTDVSIVSLIGRMSLVFAAVFGMIVFAEKYSMVSFIGFLLVVLGSLVVLYEGKRFHLTKGEIFAFIMAFGYGMVAIVDKALIQEFTPFTYALVNNAIIVALLLSFSKTARREVASLFKEKLLLVILSGAFGVISWVAFLVYIQKGAITILYPLWETTALLVTVGSGLLFLHEETRLWQKVIGVIVVVVGIFILSQ